MPRPRKPRFALLVACLLAAACALAPAAEARARAQATLSGTLGSIMRLAGPYSGANVVDSSTRQVVFARRADSARILASNTKLFTTGAALARFGSAGRIPTEVLGTGSLGAGGTWAGDLYLRGSGDPTFGTRRFVTRAYGAGTSVEALAAEVQRAGVRAVSGRVLGDESRFDSLRGGPDSGWRTSIWVGPLSALGFNRGLARENGFGFQRTPPTFAAAGLDAALERRGIRVDRPPAVRRTPADARPLAAVYSSPMERLVRITNKPSDNYAAEMLLKGLALRATGWGTTAGGARASAGFAAGLGAPARLVDGSGLSRADRASPAQVVRYLTGMRALPDYPAFRSSLAVAGRDGTLARRMRTGPARGRCRAKTGTLIGVSALSGYCSTRSGSEYAFSFLMNGVSAFAARRLQDRMAQALAGAGG